LSNHVYTPFVFLASKKWFDQLSQDEKDVIVQAAKDSQEFQRKASRQGNTDALNYLKEHKVKVSEFSTEEREKIREKVAPIVESLKAKIGAETVNGVLEAAKKASNT